MKVSQKGSHIKLRGVRDGKLQTVIVPNHKQIAAGTLSSILTSGCSL
ncbi:MAG: type II toxin-antitoxin system HicA family toxin [Candidatus Pacebacteria bacterium]|nr:type II toxin-antitoxin system HicA family toxin [Candidatus Paceibacterota bacterium]